MSGLTSQLKKVIPPVLLDAWRKLRLEQTRRRNRSRSVEAVFTEIYANNLWGGDRGSFCSGTGSRDLSLIGPYIDAMKLELQRLGSETRTVVDLGCGDYTIGGQLSGLCGRYVGVDVVRPLIEHNNATFGSATVSFVHLDMVNEDPPAGDICCIRQVLQHLSNDEIAAVLSKLDRYSYVFITEHQPSPGQLRMRNLDKPHGGDIRVTHGSGVFPGSPPFSLDPDRLRLIVEVPGHATSDGSDPGVIRTYLYEPQRIRT